jgi:outer membrane receptor protein involved in Fe transport
VRFVEPVAALGLVCAAASPAEAQSVAFNIPGGRLGAALIALSEQAGITIGTRDPGIASVRSRPVVGRMTARAALTRLLADTGFAYRFVGPRTVQVVRAARHEPRPHREPRPADPPQPPTALPAEAVIIVTGSKQGVSLERYAGTAHITELGPNDIGRFGGRGSEAVLERLPMLASTDLGPGRNKIFIRGVADSSFNGPSQSIAGLYLGDLRLTFNAPDPDLQLYDIRRVELLEGPQGTLYGTGSLGGILRFVPNPPDPSGHAASISGGLLTTRHGNTGGDLALTINLPLVADRLTLRAVGYGSVESAYIDDAGRGLTDVNRTWIYGGRATLGWTSVGDWNVELSGVVQFIAGRDGQYAERGLPPLTRASVLPQPFDNDYRLGAVTVRKRWSNAEMVSATSMVRHDLESRFDASGFPGTRGPQLFVEDIAITLLTNETRISRPDARGAGWVVGWSLLHNISDLTRRFGRPGATVPITGVRNESSEAGLFGQYSFSLSDEVTATLGGRLTFSRTAGRALDAAGEAEEPSRSDFRASPTAALSWHPSDGLLFYARHQRGFRAGGLAVSATGSEMSARRFESDSLSSFELGVRFGRTRSPFTINAAISCARWADIQADLIDPRGLPFTTNIGDGRIYGLEVEATLRPTPRLRIEASAFLNESALSRPDPAFAAADERNLPNVATGGGRLSVQYRRPLTHGIDLEVDGAIRYVGASRLGIGEPLDVRQGDYVDSQLGARIDFSWFGLSLDIDNLADARGNRFALGNPFGVGDGNQVTPLRPRTVRLGFDGSF